MKRSAKIRRLVMAFTSMILGSLLVLGSLILINHFAGSQDRISGNDGSSIVIKRKPPLKKQWVQKPKPKARSRRTPRTPLPPFTGLRTDLSGIDFGLPGYDMSGLNGLDKDLLGGVNATVMTDDTVDEPPQATYQGSMVYPPRAKAKGIKGYVLLSLLIGVTGEIEQITVVESFPAGIFDNAALHGVGQWKFAPAMYQGQAVRSWARQRIRFDLS